MKSLVLKDIVQYDPEKRVRTALIKSGGLVCEMVCYEKGQDTVTHHHPRQDEIFIVMEGKGRIVAGDEEIAVESGSIVFVEAQVAHSCSADPDSRMVMLFVKGPGMRFFDTPLNEDL